MSKTAYDFFGVGHAVVAPVNDSAEHDLEAQVFLHSDELQERLPSKIAVFRPDISGPRVDAHICPVMLENGHWVVLVTPQYQQNDLVQEVQNQCRRASKHSAEPSVYVVSASLLMSMRGANEEENGVNRSQEEVTLYKASFAEIITWAVRNGASDVHFNVEEKLQTSPIRFHIDGLYVRPQRWEMPTKEMMNVLQVAWQDGKGGGSPIFSSRIEQQCQIEQIVDSTLITGRWATLAADRGASVTIRLLKTDEETVSKPMNELGYLPSQLDQFDRAQNCEGGLLVLAGVVNSGKSTTLASVIDGIPDDRKIITMEDPVEYRMQRAIQNTVSRKLEGGDDDVFDSKLMVIKRSAVNDVMFGEVRDRAGGKAVTELQGAGIKCYTTVHAASALHIPQRLASENIRMTLDVLSSPRTLNLLVYQALLRTVCPHCRLSIADYEAEGGLDGKGIHQNKEFWKEYNGRISSLYEVDTNNVRLRNPDGCDKCKRPEIPALNGYKGRTVVSEMLEPNTDRNLLRYIKDNDFLGMQLYLDNLERAPMDNPNMDNKSIMECAVYKMLAGEIDPLVVESRTMSFKTAELMKKQHLSRKS
ncbi:putative proteinral secretion pathway ATPase [Pseudomonas cannabina]|uniref:Bacterial type II secretion system protein E domain-containing protein n=1 Tax=Pseudomonas cannabina TaxID=86840 RepID=A0A3M3M122_PSECA|nr:ATPase, T2SS/T4P/T4SS family [Pseudomonas cannabina]RMN41240.1 putative proteinral secretion pathway ATPase [Pseudomonas cannabina]